jgi:two-component system, OmpR family, sensor histidine kinase PhoQ
MTAPPQGSAADAAERAPPPPRPTRSLATRLAASAAAVLAGFVVLTAFVLDRAFADSARAARQDRLLAQVYLLMAAAEVDPQGRLLWPATLPEPRLEQPGSGLYAAVLDGQGGVAWRSASTLSAALPLLEPLPAGQQRFERLRNGDAQAFFIQRFGIRWAAGSTSHPFTFAVAEDLRPYEAQLQAWRHSLWGWLGGAAAALLLAQAAVLHWGLRPLRRMAGELRQLQAGAVLRLGGPHPRELQALADNLNRVLDHEHRQQARYRDALGDLAHSLKTPLALMRAELRGAAVETALESRLDEQIDRMDRAVAYHLQRAASGSAAALAPPLALAEPVRRLTAALRKVHADKAVRVRCDIAPALRVRLDEGDATEALGNLLDNAFKWCRGEVAIAAVVRPDGTLEIDVDDDGPGFDQSIGERVLERGVRADEQVPGHGIGLAVVREIVQAHGGRIELTRSPQGGARVRLKVPGLALEIKPHP